MLPIIRLRKSSIHISFYFYSRPIVPKLAPHEERMRRLLKENRDALSMPLGILTSAVSQPIDVVQVLKVNLEEEVVILPGKLPPLLFPSRSM